MSLRERNGSRLALRRRHLRQDRLDRARDREQSAHRCLRRRRARCRAAGRPSVIAAGRLMPGMPATLPGLRVADEGRKGRHALAVEEDRLVVADRCGRRAASSGRRPRRRRGAEVVAIGGLQLRPQHVERVAIGRLGDRAGAVQALQQAGDVGARALRDELARSRASSRARRDRRRDRRRSRRARSESPLRRRAGRRRRCRPRPAPRPLPSASPARLPSGARPRRRAAPRSARAARRGAGP